MRKPNKKNLKHLVKSHYDLMVETARQLETDMNHVYCGYIREPYQGKVKNERVAIKGVCAITEKQCKYYAPLNFNEDCIYNK